MLESFTLSRTEPTHPSVPILEDTLSQHSSKSQPKTDKRYDPAALKVMSPNMIEKLGEYTPENNVIIARINTVVSNAKFADLSEDAKADLVHATMSDSLFHRAKAWDLYFGDTWVKRLGFDADGNRQSAKKGTSQKSSSKPKSVSKITDAPSVRDNPGKGTKTTDASASDKVRPRRNRQLQATSAS